MSSIAEEIAGLTVATAAQTTASQALAQEVAGKMGQIDEKVQQYKTSADAYAEQAVASTIRALIGETGAHTSINIKAGEDAGLLVRDAYAAGAKMVSVTWDNDGQVRSWNTAVSLPVGAVLRVLGPVCTVGGIGGAARTDRACYTEANISALGSPLEFRNLEIIPGKPPHFVVRDAVSLIWTTGNNLVVFGDSSYLHDCGGMLVSAGYASLIGGSGYYYGLINYIVAGGHNSNIFLSCGLFNHGAGSSGDTHIQLWARLGRTSSDGPHLAVSKGFKKLTELGKVGAAALTNKQPYDQIDADVALNDDQYPGYNAAYLAQIKDAVDVTKGRVVTNSTWSFACGNVWYSNYKGHDAALTLGGAEQIGSRNLYLTTYGA